MYRRQEMTNRYTQLQISALLGHCYFPIVCMDYAICKNDTHVAMDYVKDPHLRLKSHKWVIEPEKERSPKGFRSFDCLVPITTHVQ